MEEMFVSLEKKKQLLGKFSFSLQILLHALTPFFLLLIFYDPGNFPQKNEQKSMNQLIEKDFVLFIILFVLLHLLKISATWEGGSPVQEPSGVIFYQLVDKELSPQNPTEKLNIKNFKS